MEGKPMSELLDWEIEEIGIGHELADEGARRVRNWLGRLGTVHTYPGGKLFLIFEGLPGIVVDPSIPLLTLDRGMVELLVVMHGEAVHRLSSPFAPRGQIATI